jgi:transaldolase
MAELRVRYGVPSVESLRVKIFADGADKAGMLEMARRPYVRGFTTNPTLMRRAGIVDYAAFARDILASLPDRPISFEVLSDEFEEMERQAREIASWGSNVFVKIPVMNTRREPSYELIARLAAVGIPLNVTALEQVERVSAALGDGAPSFVSVFAGRIADTGRDPMPLMAAAVRTLSQHRSQALLWASPRELLNLFHADAVGCHVITMTNDLLQKLPLVGRDLEQLSLETVEMFHGDARAAGYEI